MYSGLTLTRFSGTIMGAHQKIDRVSRRHLAELLGPKTSFPGIRTILHFEGKNGPDGIKRKSPAMNEPRHFINPLDVKNSDYMKLLTGHYDRLVKELRAKNSERAAFEAAWLAHTLVDGLTPAHHYPFEEKANELLGKNINTRTSVSKKLFFRGETPTQTVLKTLKAYGPRGIYMAHGLFELGFGAIIRPLRFPDARPTQREIKRLQELGLRVFLMRRAREVAVMDLYEQYLNKGWTSKLTRDMRQRLAPLIVRSVTVIWYQAALDAGQVTVK